MNYKSKAKLLCYQIYRYMNTDKVDCRIVINSKATRSFCPFSLNLTVSSAAWCALN